MKNIKSDGEMVKIVVTLDGDVKLDKEFRINDPVNETALVFMTATKLPQSHRDQISWNISGGMLGLDKGVKTCVQQLNKALKEREAEEEEAGGVDGFLRYLRERGESELANSINRAEGAGIKDDLEEVLYLLRLARMASTGDSDES